MHVPLLGHHAKCYSADDKCYCQSNQPFVLPPENAYEAKYAGHGPKCYLYDAKCYCSSAQPYILPPYDPRKEQQIPQKSYQNIIQEMSTIKPQQVQQPQVQPPHAVGIPRHPFNPSLGGVPRPPQSLHPGMTQPRPSAPLGFSGMQPQHRMIDPRTGQMPPSNNYIPNQPNAYRMMNPRPTQFPSGIPQPSVQSVAQRIGDPRAIPTAVNSSPGSTQRIVDPRMVNMASREPQFSNAHVQRITDPRMGQMPSNGSHPMHPHGIQMMTDPKLGQGATSGGQPLQLNGAQRMIDPKIAHMTQNAPNSLNVHAPPRITDPYPSKVSPSCPNSQTSNFARGTVDPRQ
ncbi:hypothetical protein SK128_017071, partial [Halocaridina rubra]